jgi:ribonuclease P protein component
MTRGARGEGLARRHRFSIQGSFGAVLRSPRKIRAAGAILHVATGTPGISRLGIALTRRLLPRAVDRNRVKRIVREAFRRHPAKGAGLDVVIALRERPDTARTSLWAAEVRLALDRLLEKGAR